jgi:RNase P subunit RPR2
MHRHEALYHGVVDNIFNEKRKENVVSLSVAKEVKFSCHICNKSYTRKDTLTKHQLRIHDQKFDFCCGICSKLFVSGSILRAHQRKAHAGVEYFCQKCDGRRFPSQAELRDHKRVFHSSFPVFNNNRFFSKSHFLPPKELTERREEKMEIGDGIRFSNYAFK